MATPAQTTATEALKVLQLEQEPGGIPGGHVRMKITQVTVDFIRNMQGKTAMVDSQGDVTFELSPKE